MVVTPLLHTVTEVLDVKVTSLVEVIIVITPAPLYNMQYSVCTPRWGLRWAARWGLHWGPRWRPCWVLVGGLVGLLVGVLVGVLVGGLVGGLVGVLVCSLG